MGDTQADATYREPVFIVGLPRSGTTLLQGVLCNSGMYFPMPETHFFSRVTCGLPDGNFSEEDRKQLSRVLTKKSKIEVDEEILYQLNSKKEIFEHIIEIFNLDNKNTFLEKTPRHVFFYSEIIKYYPDAKFICMIREPKNSVSSLLTMSSRRQKSTIRISIFYNKIAKAILRISRNNNVLIVKYEDLVDRSGSTLKSICKFLNIPYSSSLIDNVTAPAGIVSAHEIWKNRNIELETIQKNNPERWREVLNQAQADMVTFITKSYAFQFGYDLAYDWTAVCSGFMQDLGRLLTRRELRKAFSKVY
jgi:hypothetical protein